MDIPSHLMTEIRKAQQLEKHRESDPRAIEPLIQIYEWIVGQTEPNEYPIFYAMICGGLGDAYADRLNDDQAANVKQAIQYYKQALRFLTLRSNPEEFAMIQNNLGIAYSDLPVGERAANLTQAIQCYQEVLRVRTPQSDPLEYAGTQNNLGNAYFELLTGDRASNLQQAIQCYQEALRFYTPQTVPHDYALMHANLGNIYLDLSTGDRASNLQQAIQHYQQALRFFTPKVDRLKYAGIQSNLGNVYLAMPTGDPTKNLKQALRYYQEALRFLTPQTASLDYATIQTNLGNIYQNMPSDDRTENLQQAIHYYQEALRFFTPQTDPSKYAMVQNNLGETYRKLPTDNRSNSLTQAIKYYQEALRFFTPQTNPTMYAIALNNLGDVYLELPSGDRAANVEQAIRCYREALRFRTPQADPLKHAETQNNLGVAYFDLPTGDRAANLEQAIRCYQEALRFRTPQADPFAYARTQGNLGNAYGNRIKGDRMNNLTRAIQHYDDALHFYTPQNDPLNYAMIQSNLGTAYWDLTTGDRAHNLKQAIHNYQEALRFYLPHIDPLKYAGLQNNLGNVYGELPTGDRTRNLALAIHCYQEALRFYLLDVEPFSYRRTARSLASIYFDQGAWQEALQTYRLAMQAGEQLYRVGLSTESKNSEASVNATLYPNAAFAAVRCGETSEALLILERGKTRLLNEALRLRVQRPPQIPDELWQKFEDAGAHVRANQAEKFFTVEKVQDYEAHIQAVREASNVFNTIAEHIRTYAPAFLTAIDLPTIESQLLDTHTALITFCITWQGSVGFVVSRCPQLKIETVELPTFTHADIQNLIAEYGAKGQTTGGWLGAYDHYNKRDTGTWQIAFEIWQQTITNVLSVLGERLMTPVLSSLSPDITHIILQPAAELFLFPLHAAPLFGDASKLVCDHYQVSYSPSIEVLLNTKARATREVIPSLYAAINPLAGTSLNFAESEGQAISELFAHKEVDKGRDATKNNVIAGVREKTYVHFSCHGGYDWDDPTLSSLLLTDGILTLAELQEGIIELSQARLVVLSACETGISDVIQSSPEEYVGIPAGFLRAGVPCVVSSLWAVDDLSTTLLMERFYQNHLQQKMDFAAALRESQAWIRHATAQEMNLANRWERIYQKSRENDVNAARTWLYYRDHPEIQPFTHPYYWAAFTVNGL